MVELPGDLLPDRGGSATTDGDTVTYTPAIGFVGFEEFTYTAQDAGLDGGDDPPAVDQDTAVVVVNVLENIIPDAVDDVATTLQDQALTIDVLENDSLGNAPNTVAIETEPANGSATAEPDNSIRYSPNSNFFGEDSFEYRLTDANGDSDVATVTVGVFFVRGQVSIDIMPNSDGNNLNLRVGPRRRNRCCNPVCRRVLRGAELDRSVDAEVRSEGGEHLGRPADSRCGWRRR